MYVCVFIQAIAEEKATEEAARAQAQKAAQEKAAKLAPTKTPVLSKQAPSKPAVTSSAPSVVPAPKEAPKGMFNFFGSSATAPASPPAVKSPAPSKPAPKSASSSSPSPSPAAAGPSDVALATGSKGAGALKKKIVISSRNSEPTPTPSLVPMKDPPSTSSQSQVSSNLPKSVAALITKNGGDMGMVNVAVANFADGKSTNERFCQDMIKAMGSSDAAVAVIPDIIGTLSRGERKSRLFEYFNQQL